MKRPVDPTRNLPAAIIIALSGAATLISDAALGGTGGSVFVPCDIPVAGRIDPAIDSDFFHFSILDGETLTISVVEAPSAPIAFTGFWRLLDGLGSPAVDCGLFTFGQDDCGPLPASGNPYQIHVEDFFNDEVGDYWVHLQRLSTAQPCDEIPLTCGTPTDSAIEHIAENDLVSFCVAEEGSTVFVNVVEDLSAPLDFTAFWRLLDGSGSLAADCGSFTFGQDDCGPLPASGNPYRVQVQDFFNDAPGDYSVAVDVLAGSCFACVPVSIFSDGFESGDTAVWSATVAGN